MVILMVILMVGYGILRVEMDLVLGRVSYGKRMIHRLVLGDSNGVPYVVLIGGYMS